MPTSPNTHEIARAVRADARVAYVDNDAIVLSHLDALLVNGNQGIMAVDADARDADRILTRVSDGIDFSAPACPIMGALLHFFDAASARDLVARYAAALAPGSYIILTVGVATGERAETFFRMYLADGPTRLTSIPRRISRRSSDPWRWCRPVRATPGPRGPAGPGYRPPRSATPS